MRGQEAHEAPDCDPHAAHDYLLSFVLARLLLLVEVGVLLGFGAWVFQVPVRGSMLELAALCVLGSLAFSALGLLVASRARPSKPFPA